MLRLRLHNAFACYCPDRWCGAADWWRGLVVLQWHERRHDLFAADPSQFLLHPFGIRHALDPKLIIDAKDDRSTVGVRESNDSLRDLFAV